MEERERRNGEERGEIGGGEEKWMEERGGRGEMEGGERRNGGEREEKWGKREVRNGGREEIPLLGRMLELLVIVVDHTYG